MVVGARRYGCATVDRLNKEVEIRSVDGSAVRADRGGWLLLRPFLVLALETGAGGEYTFTRRD